MREFRAEKTPERLFQGCEEFGQAEFHQARIFVARPVIHLEKILIALRNPRGKNDIGDEPFPFEGSFRNHKGFGAAAQDGSRGISAASRSAPTA